MKKRTISAKTLKSLNKAGLVAAVNAAGLDIDISDMTNLEAVEILEPMFGENQYIVEFDDDSDDSGEPGGIGASRPKKVGGMMPASSLPDDDRVCVSVQPGQMELQAGLEHFTAGVNGRAFAIPFNTPVLMPRYLYNMLSGLKETRMVWDPKNPKEKKEYTQYRYNISSHDKGSPQYQDAVKLLAENSHKPADELRAA